MAFKDNCSLCGAAEGWASGAGKIGKDDIERWVTLCEPCLGSFVWNYNRHKTEMLDDMERHSRP